MTMPAEKNAVVPLIHDSEDSHAKKSLTDAEMLAMIDALSKKDRRRLEIVLQGAASGELPPQ